MLTVSKHRCHIGTLEVPQVPEFNLSTFVIKTAMPRYKMGVHPVLRHYVAISCKVCADFELYSWLERLQIDVPQAQSQVLTTLNELALRVLQPFDIGHHVSIDLSGE